MAVVALLRLVDAHCHISTGYLGLSLFGFAVNLDLDLDEYGFGGDSHCCACYLLMRAYRANCAPSGFENCDSQVFDRSGGVGSIVVV